VCKNNDECVSDIDTKFKKCLQLMRRSIKENFVRKYVKCFKKNANLIKKICLVGSVVERVKAPF